MAPYAGITTKRTAARQATPDASTKPYDHNMARDIDAPRASCVDGIATGRRPAARRNLPVARVGGHAIVEGGFHVVDAQYGELRGRTMRALATLSRNVFGLSIGGIA